MASNKKASRETVLELEGPEPSKKSTSGLVIAEQRYTVQIKPSLERLSKADPANVQEIVASQIELMTVYHNVVLEQAQRSFRWALIAAGIGLVFFLASVGFVLSQQLKNATVISLIAGALIEVISAINFHLYGKTSAQLADFQSRLDTTQRFLLANSICESLDGDVKQTARSDLVRVIAGTDMAVNGKLSQDLPRTEQVHSETGQKQTAVKEKSLS